MPLKKREVTKFPYELEWLEEPWNNARGEEALWIAVITQALMDALNRSKKAESLYQKREARYWLTEGKADFFTVCDYAGLDPFYVRMKAKRTLAKPRRWRAKAGKGPRYLERKAYRESMKQTAKPAEAETATIINFNYRSAL